MVKKILSKTQIFENANSVYFRSAKSETGGKCPLIERLGSNWYLNACGFTLHTSRHIFFKKVANNWSTMMNCRSSLEKLFVVMK